MNPFPRLQQDAADALLSSPAFASVPVILDDGRQDQEITKHLTKPGVCVVVHMVNGWNVNQTAHKTAIGDASLMVEVIVNPQIYKGSVPQLVGEVALAVTASPLVQARNHFTVEGFDMVANLPGLIGYELDLKRSATVSA